MGANAQTSVPTFTAGEILTAANMNISARTGIPVFADSTARDAAFGGTGEKTLAEGQYAYLEDTNATQVYDGSTWQAVGAASGLVYISGATFTTVATVSMPSGTFTSTYQNYVVTFNITASSVSQTIGIRVNNVGTPRTATNYFGAKTDVDASAGQTLTGSSSATLINSMATLDTYITLGATIQVYSPTATTTHTSFTGQTFGANNGLGGSANTIFGGSYNALEAHDGLTFVVGGTISGNYRVYGIANS
jgi:hypothetical protein